MIKLEKGIVFLILNIYRLSHFRTLIPNTFSSYNAIAIILDFMEIDYLEKGFKVSFK